MRNWLRNLRKNNHLTQQEIANKMDMSLKTYNLIELGKRQKDLNLSTAIKLSQIFDISLEKIKYFENYEQRQEKEAQDKINAAMKGLNENV